MKILLLLLLFHVTLIHAKCAFVTLIAGPEPEFVDGALVLGKSLLNVKNGADIDMILLYKSGLNFFQIEELTTNGGWVLKELSIEIPQPPGHEFKSRFVDMFDKLTIFSLVEYNTVVYLDADTLVLDNIDELCNVDAEVAAVSRGPTANMGVIIVQPSTAKFVQMVEAVTTYKPNYPNNDQGIMNIVHGNFLNCEYIDPLKEDLFVPDTLKCARIPSRYNADVLIYAVNGDHWPYDPDISDFQHPKIIHYTFGDIKPWAWYSYLLTPNVILWWDVKQETQTFQERIVSGDVMAMGYLVALAVIILVLPNHYYSGWLYVYGYVPLSKHPTALICFYLALNGLIAYLSYIITSLFVFNPFANTILFVLVYSNFMRIILFNHLESNSAVITLCVMTIQYLVLFSMIHLGEQLTFFARIAIIVSLLVIFHWFFCWTIFIRFILEPLCKQVRKDAKLAEKLI